MNTKESYQLGGQSLLLGDSLKLLPEINEKFDACITDPPYNISGYDNKKTIGWLKSSPYWKEKKGFNKIDAEWDKFSDVEYLSFTEKWLELVCDKIKPNGNILIFGTYHNIYKMGYLLEQMGKKIMNSIVWYKRNAFPNITNRMLCESTEHIVWAVNNDKKKATNWTFNYNLLKELNGGKQMRNVWDIPMTPTSERKMGKHPSQKSMEVIKRLVLGFTNEGDHILDPFMGSGTVPLVCLNEGRKTLCIEKEKEYFDLTKRRLIEEKRNTKMGDYE